MKLYVCPKCNVKFAYQRFCPSCYYYLSDEEYGEHDFWGAG
jgi:hypothetical protein